MEPTLKESFRLSGLLILGAFAGALFVVAVMALSLSLFGFQVEFSPDLEKIMYFGSITASAATLLMFCVFFYKFYNYENVFEKKKKK